MQFLYVIYVLCPKNKFCGFISINLMLIINQASNIVNSLWVIAKKINYGNSLHLRQCKLNENLLFSSKIGSLY